jgi:hypothetical protein
MPGGRSVPLATQKQFLDDAARIRQFRQNAGIFRRDLVSYFPKSASGDAMRWVALPDDGLGRMVTLCRRGRSYSCDVDRGDGTRLALSAISTAIRSRTSGGLVT